MSHYKYCIIFGKDMSHVYVFQRKYSTVFQGQQDYKFRRNKLIAERDKVRDSGVYLPCRQQSLVGVARMQKLSANAQNHRRKYCITASITQTK